MWLFIPAFLPKSVNEDKTINEPAHEIMVNFVLHKLNSSNTHAQPSSGARCLIFGRTLRLLPYFMCANSEGSGETAQMRRLAWAFAGRLCDKYHNLMSWLKWHSEVSISVSSFHVLLQTCRLWRRHPPRRGLSQWAAVSLGKLTSFPRHLISIIFLGHQTLTPMMIRYVLLSFSHVFKTYILYYESSYTG